MGRESFPNRDGVEGLCEAPTYRQHFLYFQQQHKLEMKYFGLFKVLKRIGAEIHPVLHISLLNKCIGMLDHQVTLLQLQDDGQQEKSLNLADKVLIGEGGNVMTTSVGGLQSAARSLFLQKLKM